MTVILDEYFTILFNLEALPSFSWVLNFFTFLHSVVTASHDSLSSAGGCCGALSTLFFAFVVSLLFDQTFTNGEIFSDLLISRDRSIHPWVLHDLLDCWPLAWVQDHHLFEEILELSRIDVIASFSFCMSLPEDLGASSSNEAIMRIVRVCRSEWRSLGEDHEENDCRGKKINTRTFISFSEMNLRGHVGSSSKLGLKEARAITSSRGSGKTEVRDLESEASVEK